MTLNQEEIQAVRAALSITIRTMAEHREYEPEINTAFWDSQLERYARLMAKFNIAYEEAVDGNN